MKQRKLKKLLNRQIRAIRQRNYKKFCKLAGIEQSQREFVNSDYQAWIYSADAPHSLFSSIRPLDRDYCASDIERGVSRTCEPVAYNWLKFILEDSRCSLKRMSEDIRFTKKQLKEFRRRQLLIHLAEKAQKLGRTV